MIINVKHVKIGPNCKIDDQALVGYMPQRKIEVLDLVMMDEATVRSGSVVYLGSKIGRRLETSHNVTIREQNTVGDGVKIWGNSVLDYGCKIGNNVKIHTNCYIAQLTVIEDNVFIAPGVMVSNEKYPTGVFNSERIKGPTIKRDAKIGIASIIMPGVVIGENALVGAGSLVIKNVPPNTMVYGTPARVIKNVDEVKEQ
jgi:acetyltransferase-like isoleucine patch superfamily enzyme